MLVKISLISDEAEDCLEWVRLTINVPSGPSCRSPSLPPSLPAMPARQPACLSDSPADGPVTKVSRPQPPDYKTAPLRLSLSRLHTGSR